VRGGKIVRYELENVEDEEAPAVAEEHDA
jgi:hypothetical protein